VSSELEEFRKWAIGFDPVAELPVRVAQSLGRQSVVSRKTVLRKRLAAMEEELANLERFPKDTFADRSVIRFDKGFENTDKQYAYAAIKANDRWYLTGSTAPLQGMSWDELVSWMSDGVSEVYLMQDHDLIVAPLVEDTEESLPIDTAGHFDPELSE